MSQLSSALGNQGPCVTFTDPDTGKQYPIGYKTQKVKAAFCEFLEERA